MQVVRGGDALYVGYTGTTGMGISALLGVQTIVIISAQ